MINKLYINCVLQKQDSGIKIIPENSDLMQTYLKELTKNDVESKIPIELCIVKTSEKKSNKQLAYFFSTILPIIKEEIENLEGIVYNKEDIMFILKDMFFYEEIYIGGEFKKIHLSLEKATVKEVDKFIKNIIEFGRNSLNLNIPELNDYKITKLLNNG